MLQLELADADHQMRDLVGVIDVEHALGKLAGLIDVAVGEHREKGAAQQIRILRIELEHIHVIGGRGGGIALGAGMARGEIAAGGVLRRKFRWRRRLNGGRLGGEHRWKTEGREAMPSMAACRGSSE